MKIVDKIKKFWYFAFANPVAQKGEKGGFKWVFRRFTLEISTVSGNFKMRFTAAPHPYAYLLAGDESQTHGFAERMYMVGSLLTTDQKFVNDIDKAISNYQRRLNKQADVKDDETEEKIALEEVKAVQDYVEMDKKEKRKYERDVNGRFKKAVKNVENEGA